MDTRPCYRTNMASYKYVWSKCTICNGTGVYGEDLVAVHVDGVFGAPGHTSWEKRDLECTNCMGDKGHRIRVIAPDPPTPDWWG